MPSMSDTSINSGARLFVVDDNRAQGEELAAALSKVGYDHVRVIADAGDPSIHLAGAPPELVLVDLDASGSRKAAAAACDAIPSTVAPPILGITCDSTPEGRRRAATLGVHDFAIRPLEGLELRMRVDSALATARLRRLLSDRSARLTEALRDHSSEVDTVRESLSVLAAVADFHDDDTDQHAHRVGVLSGAIARALELPDNFVTRLAEAAPLHDIGKVGISRRILLKPGSLTPSERIHMMQHVDIGGRILAAAQSPVLVLAAEIARTHHERWDGSGYTNGLAADQIPLSGRIVAVADVWDTLTHDRPYRAAWTPESALSEIYNQAGEHFDPTVVEAFSSLERDVLEPLGSLA